MICNAVSGAHSLSAVARDPIVEGAESVVFGVELAESMAQSGSQVKAHEGIATGKPNTHYVRQTRGAHACIPHCSLRHATHT